MHRWPATFAALLVAILVVSGWRPPSGHLNWFLEVLPIAAEAAVLVALYKRFRLTNLVYGLVVVHAVIVAYGGYYTYAATPLGNWASETFDLSRNHYDRLGHLALGFCPALLIREVLLRCTPLVRGGWLTFLILCVALAVGAFWELIEWWTVLLVAADVGSAYLGMQGDPWDAHWDMVLALVGAALAVVTLSRLHDAGLRAQEPVSNVW